MRKQLQPLKEGEGVDLDTGTEVKREKRRPNFYCVRSYNTTLEQEELITLEDEEIRQIAELAGYSVSDE